MRKLIVLLLVLPIVIGCEYFMGPEGPQGEQGPGIEYWSHTIKATETTHYYGYYSTSISDDNFRFVGGVWMDVWCVADSGAWYRHAPWYSETSSRWYGIYYWYADALTWDWPTDEAGLEVIIFQADAEWLGEAKGGRFDARDYFDEWPPDLSQIPDRWGG